jgi:hypothetical protein
MMQPAKKSIDSVLVMRSASGFSDHNERHLPTTVRPVETRMAGSKDGKQFQTKSGWLNLMHKGARRK